MKYYEWKFYSSGASPTVHCSDFIISINEMWPFEYLSSFFLLLIYTPAGGIEAV